MKQELVTVVYTCDLCNKECEPVRELKLFHSWGYLGETQNSIIVRVGAKVAHNSYGEVCETCLHDALKAYLNKSGKDE